MTCLYFLLGCCAWLEVQESPPPTVAALIEKLRSDSPAEREQAMQKLKERGKAAEPELRKAAEGKDPEVAGRAGLLLRILEIRERLTPGLLKALPGVEERLAAGGDREWAKLFLEATGEAAQYPHLKAEDWEVLASGAMQRAEGAEAKKALCRHMMVKRLRPAIPAIVTLLKEEDAGVRHMAVGALGDLGAKEAAPAIVPLLKDGTPSIRSKAVQTLGVLGAKEAIPEILKLLQDAHGEVRSDVPRVLAALGAKNAAPAIAPLLKDADARARWRAAEVLGTLGATEAVPEIIKLLTDVSAEVRSVAAGALGTMGAKEAVPEIVKLLNDKIYHVRSTAAAQLGILGAKEAIPEILKLLQEENAWVRSWAAEGLGTMGATEATPAIVKLLKDGDARVRSRAAGALAALGATEAAPEIARLLTDPEYQARYQAAWSLGVLDAKESAPELVKLLKDRDPGVALAAAASLARLGSWEGVGLVVQDPASRGAGHRSLNALRQPEVWKRLREKRWSDDRRGTTGAMIALVAREAGMTLDLPEDASGKEWLEGRVQLRSRGGAATVLEALETVVSARPPYHDFILEADRIRIVPHPKASEFWQAWWAGETKDKK